MAYFAKMDGNTKKKVMPELMPRTLFWFRWGAAWTWITGIILLYIIFWHGSLAVSYTHLTLPTILLV